MTFEVDTTKVDISYDHAFETMSALKWWPWIGREFKNSKNKTLILGESTYIWDAANEDEEKRKQEEARIRTRVSRNDHLRILHQNHALNYSRPSKYVRNIERAISQSKAPSDVDKDKLWANVVYHNLVLRPMASLKHRPSDTDYEEGWQVMLDLATLLEIDQCIVYGLEWKKIGSLLSILKLKSEQGELTYKHHKFAKKIGQSFPRVVTIEINGRCLKIIFIRHPSSFFNWEKWGEVIKTEILSPVANTIEDERACSSSIIG